MAGKITVNDSLFINEQSEAQADVEGQGQIWVKDSTPNELWFTDDEGNDAKLGTADNDISTPETTTDNAVVRWDGTDGSAIQDSNITISDAGLMTTDTEGIEFKGEPYADQGTGIYTTPTSYTDDDDSGYWENETLCFNDNDNDYGYSAGTPVTYFRAISFYHPASFVAKVRFLLAKWSDESTVQVQISYYDGSWHTCATDQAITMTKTAYEFNLAGGAVVPNVTRYRLQWKCSGLANSVYLYETDYYLYSAVSKSSIVKAGEPHSYLTYTLPTETGSDGDLLKTDGSGVLSFTSINDYSADASPDGASDYVMTYDASAATHKKVLLEDLPNNAEVDDSLFLSEQSEAQADVAGQGQIWVKNTTPNELWFTDDAGTDFQLGTVDMDTSTPGTTTDNAIVRWDGTDGSALQDSNIIISDAGLITTDIEGIAYKGEPYADAGTGVYTTPTSYTDDDGSYWVNPTLCFNDNEADYGYAAGSPTTYFRAISFHHPSSFVAKVRFMMAKSSNESTVQVQISYYDGSWHTCATNQALTTTKTTYEFNLSGGAIVPNVTRYRLQWKCSGLANAVLIYETDYYLHSEVSKTSIVKAGEPHSDLTFTLPTETGSDGDIVKTNGSGVLSFTSINDYAADASPDNGSDYVMTYDASAAVHKKVLLDDLPGGGGPTGFSSNARAYLSSNQSIPDSTDTKVLFDTETFDTDSEYDNSTSYRFTATNAGRYLVTSKITFAEKLTGKSYINKIYVNGSSCYEKLTTAEATLAGTAHSVTQSEIVSLAASDYVEVFAYQDTGSALNVLGDIKYTSFAIHRLS